ncbi:MAG: phage tail tape measure protein [Lachnospiraceae bacterium]|nr:MAG: phage tail tape measure protein [Lachnospiraceae bacterium]
MTEVRKVRKVYEGTEAQYKSFQQTVSSTAQEIASTNKELINSSADFSRLGYSLEQAESLAKNTTLFVNVGDGIDITAATEDMITAMKAFDIKAEDSIKIVDNYNQIGNKFALSATDIGEAMKRSASALETGNSCLE